MKIRIIFWFVFISTFYQVAIASQTKFYNYDDYFDFEPEMKDIASLNVAQRPNKLILNGLSPADIMSLAEQQPPAETTECTTAPLLSTPPSQESNKNDASENSNPRPTSIQNNEDDKARQLKNLVQLLYIAQARVQLEAAEIKKAQAIANSAQQSLEESANNVRQITANLQSSQQEVANAAIRAQTAQLQLAAHDQLLFAARQDVDALSTQLVGLQAAEGVTQPKATVDLADLLEKLKQPLKEDEKPTPVPTVVKISTEAATYLENHKLQHLKAPDYQHFYYK